MKKYFNKTILFLILILLLAAFLRLYRISSHMGFLGDEGRDVLVAKDILSGQFTLLGPRSSAGDFYMGPFYYYLITPFLLLFNYDPVGPAIMVALFGVATVLLVYIVGKNFFGRLTGLFAAALYAVSTLVLAYSHSSWNPDVLPFFSLLLIYTVFNVVTKSKPWKHFLLIGILLGICLQLHYLSLFLAVIIFIYIFLTHLMQFCHSERGTSRGISHHRADKTDLWYEIPPLSGYAGSVGMTTVIPLFKNYLGILLGAVISLSPFILFELRHNFLNTKGILTFLFGNTVSYSTNANFFETSVQVFFRIFARLVFDFPAPDKAVQFSSLQLIIWGSLAMILAIFSIFIMFKRSKKPVSLILGLWLFISVFLFGFYKKEIYDYLFTFIFPLPFLLIGNLLSYIFYLTPPNLPLSGKGYRFLPLIRGSQRGFQILSFLIFSAIFATNLLNNPFRYEPNNQRDQAKGIAQFVISKTDNKPYNFALLSKSNSDYAYRYYLEILGSPPVYLENLEKDPMRVSATGQLLIVCEDIYCNPIGNPLHDVAAFGQAEIVGVWDVSVVKVYKLVQYKEGATKDMNNIQTNNSSEVSVEEVKKAIDLQENIILLDVRTLQEYEKGHIDSSTLLPFDTVSGKVTAIIPDKTQKTYVYCLSGSRSAQAVKTMVDLGYTNVY
ncbi:glycosyltransferase family 39 protein, partial [Patescibacteria group bacterium]|nr:glycosyltransferase family 39 protein [Patescibacteria group bacterium]